MIWLFTLCLVSLLAGFTSLVRPPYQADMAPYQANTHRYQAVSWRRETTLILTMQRYEIYRRLPNYFSKKARQKARCCFAYFRCQMSVLSVAGITSQIHTTIIYNIYIIYNSKIFLRKFLFLKAYALKINWHLTSDI